MKPKHCEHSNNLWSFTAKRLSFLILFLAIVAVLGFGGCATSPETGPAGAEMASVTGTVVYIESIKFPAETEVQVSLIEMMGKHGPARQMTVQNIKRNIEVPIPFTLQYDPEEEPDILWRQNDELLKQLGIFRQLRTLFLNNPVYSPRHHTRITHALSSIKGLKGADRFIELTNEARSEIDAFTFQQIADMISGFNRKQAPVLEIFKLQDLPVAYAKDGTLLAAYPADRLRWTPYSASLARQFSANPFKAINVQKTVIWITGSLSPRMKQELAKLNINFVENISAD